MNGIAEQEYADVLGRIEKDILGKRDEFAGYSIFEDNYSPNDIAEAQSQLLMCLNEHFEANELPYIAFCGCDYVRVWKEEWYAAKYEQ